MPSHLIPENGAIKDTAERLFSACLTAAPIAPIGDLIEGDPIAAYRVQAINTARGLAGGRQLIGRKIGLTSNSVQQQLGVNEPDYGMLFSDMRIADGGSFDLSRLIQPKMEAEVALIMGAELTDPGIEMDELISAIDCVLPAIEIVDSRIMDWQISLADTIADNASSGLFVLGETRKRLDEFDPVKCEMTLSQNGVYVSTGRGADCLGSPLNAALWLARVMAETDYPLLAGTVVLTGALGPMVPAVSGAVYQAVISGLGSVSVEVK